MTEHGQDRDATLRRLRELLARGPEQDAQPVPAGRTDPAVPTAGLAAVDPEEERARAYLLRSLSAASRTRGQLARGLRDREVPGELADRLLDRFTEVGLIDDADYAARLARTRMSERGLSRRAIGAELRRKGVAEQDVDAALDQLDPQDEEGAARALVRSRLPRLSGLSQDVQIRRLAGVLGRKGYSSGLSLRIIRAELRGEWRAE